MQRRHSALAIFCVAICGCSSSDDGGGNAGGGGGTSGSGGTGGGGTGGGGTCSTPDECVPMGCECADGEIFHGEASCDNGSCAPAEQVCEAACSNNGGLVNSGPEGTVEDSPECAAFCDKVFALDGCENADCSKQNWCKWQYGGCPEGKQKYLQCAVDQGTFECTGAGTWSYSAGSCLKFETECN